MLWLSTTEGVSSSVETLQSKENEKDPICLHDLDDKKQKYIFVSMVKYLFSKSWLKCDK